MNIPTSNPYPANDGLGIADYAATYAAITASHHHLGRRFYGQPVYFGASKLIYFKEAEPHACMAADLIVATDLARHTGPSGAWLIWHEGKATDLIVEVDQPRHQRPDAVIRQSMYADAGVAEYLVYNPLAHADSPPVQSVIGPAIPPETDTGISTWYSPALGCYLHTLRGLPGIYPTHGPESPYNDHSYRVARDNLTADIARLRRQITDREADIASANRWLQAISDHNPGARAKGTDMATEKQPTSPTRTDTDPKMPATPDTADADAYTPRTLASKLQAAFNTMPSEPGCDHPEADRIIATLIPNDANIATLTVISADLNGRNPHLAWNTLVRIAHTSPDWPTEAKISIVNRCLGNDSPMVREGAIQAAEAWADQTMLQLLQDHHETNERLATYVSEVITDITSSLRLHNA